MQHGCQHFGRFFPVFSVVPPAGNDTGKVVAAHKQAVPALVMQSCLPAGHRLFQLDERQRRKVPFGFARLLVEQDMFKLEHHRQLAAIRRTVQFCPFQVCPPCFANRHHAPFLESFGAEFAQIFMQAGTIIGDTTVRLLRDLVNDIQAETCNSLFHPPKDHIIQFPAQCRVFPVQVRLLGRKLMEIILPDFRYPCPRGTAKSGLHIIRILIRRAVSPDIVVVAGIIAAGLCLQKPAMLVRTVVQNHIQHNADPALFAFGNQLPHIFQRTVHRINCPVV